MSALAFDAAGSPDSTCPTTRRADVGPIATTDRYVAATGSFDAPTRLRRGPDRAAIPGPLNGSLASSPARCAAVDGFVALVAITGRYRELLGRRDPGTARDALRHRRAPDAWRPSTSSRSRRLPSCLGTMRSHAHRREPRRCRTVHIDAPRAASSTSPPKLSSVRSKPPPRTSRVRGGVDSAATLSRPITPRSKTATSSISPSARPTTTLPTSKPAVAVTPSLDLRSHDHHTNESSDDPEVSASRVTGTADPRHDQGGQRCM